MRINTRNPRDCLYSNPRVVFTVNAPNVLKRNISVYIRNSHSAIPVYTVFELVTNDTVNGQ